MPTWTWWVVVAGLVCLVVGWIGGSARFRDLRRAVEDLAARVDALAPPAEPAATAVYAPGLVEAAKLYAGSELPRSGVLDATVVAADFPAPDEVESEFRAAMEAADQLRTEVLASVREEGGVRGDLSDLFEIEDDDAPDDDQPPTGSGGGHGEPLCAEAPMPRYHPETAAERWPADRGVLPSTWMLYRWRLRTWWNRRRGEWAAWRQLETVTRVRAGLALPALPLPLAVRKVRGRHRPEWVEQHRIGAPRPVGRVLRPDWRELIRTPRAALSVFPSLDCSR